MKKSGDAKASDMSPRGSAGPECGPCARCSYLSKPLDCKPFYPV